MPFRSAFVSRRRLLAAATAWPLSRAALARAPDPAAPPLAPQLALVDDGRVDPSRYFVSEKYDGVRALWDGRTLRHRSGRVVAAPAAFLAVLPAMPLDGELWFGRGRFEALSALVRRREPRDDAWSAVRYMVFDSPVAGPAFADRLAALRAAPLSLPIEVAPQWRLAARPALQRALERVVAGGGEGLMLHEESALYVGGRSPTLLKLKPHLDAEAVVVGHRAGAGKYAGALGALEVESPQGRRFFIGSGLDDAARRRPPPIGAVVTYRYRDVTSSGLPRFATYLRPYDPD